MAEKGHFGEGKKGFVILAPFCHPRAFLSSSRQRGSRGAVVNPGFPPPGRGE